MHEQHLEEEKLKTENLEERVRKISGEALEAMEQYKAEKDYHKTKEETMEKKIQDMDKESMLKENVILEMKGRLTEISSENDELKYKIKEMQILKDKKILLLKMKNAKIQALDKNCNLKHKDTMVLERKLMQFLKENKKLKNKEVLIEKMKKDIKERDERITSLENKIWAMRRQIAQFGDKEEEMKIRQEDLCQENLHIQEVRGQNYTKCIQ